MVNRLLKYGVIFFFLPFYFLVVDAPLQNIRAPGNDHDSTIEQNRDGVPPQSIPGLVISPRPKCVDPQDQDRSVGLKDDSFLRCMAEDLSSIHPHKQHPSFNKWMYPQDTKMKHVNGSLILKSLIIDNCGRDEFWKAVNNITLSVGVPPGQTGGDTEDGFRASSPQHIRIEPLQNTLAADNDHDSTIEQNKDGLRDVGLIILHKHPHLECVDPQDQDRSVGLKDAQKNIIAKLEQNTSLPCQVCVKNRVDLQDQETNAGDVALILKNVTIYDTGTYKCRVLREKNTKSISIIYLHVDPPGQTGGDTEDGFRASCNRASCNDSFSDGFSSAI
ncbi:uncharacterized protein LOC102309030 isoform X2 [Haplochromis burtoni]|uniref:uncharacterized protein LOC102309030 isoform X2 n=1 Tax=Haplochromis burtoni TaxID=8153 RepID=UPI001C2D4925|nr:uncharacterized protein LOC102309030 isoform X2 [Haplochromis burtoni]